MGQTVVIAASPQDREIAEAARSILERQGVECRLTEGESEDLAGVKVLLVILSLAGATPQTRALLRDLERRWPFRPVVVLRIGSAPLPDELEWLRAWHVQSPPALRPFYIEKATKRVLGFLDTAGGATRARTGYSPLDPDLPQSGSEGGTAGRRRPTRGGFRGVRGPKPDAEGEGERSAPPDRGLAEPPPAYGVPPSGVEVPVAAPLLQDNVHFSVFAPPAIPPGTRFLLSVWAFLEKDREKALARARQGDRFREAGARGPVKIGRGTEVAVVLDLPGFEVDEPSDTIAWEGEIGNAAFDVLAPQDLASGRHTGKVRFLVAGIQVARLVFELEVGPERRQETDLGARSDRIRTMFASYATEDRPAVLRFKQGAEAAGVDVFVDVTALRSGQDWQKALRREIVSRDLLCLFWSAAARKSEWVEREWRLAFTEKGPDHIYPVPLADPRDVPPPPELGANKHFNDLSQIVLAYEILRLSSPPPA